jgi:hypothetical protein
VSEQHAEEPPGSAGVAPLLQEDIQSDSVLVDGPPEPVPLATDVYGHLVQVPHAAGLYLPPSKLLRVARAKLGHPAADALVRDLDAALGQQLLNVPETQGETQVEPDRMADDHLREAAAVLGG